MILGANPVSQYLSYKKDIDQALEKVLSSGNYILGEEVEAFEDEFSNYVGVNNGVGVGSGTEALHIALKACDIGPGDEVITVSHTAVATAAAITMSGAKPVFVDIEPRFYNVDPNKIQSAISSTTKAIIPVHLYGCPAEMDSILDIAKKNNRTSWNHRADKHGESKITSFNFKLYSGGGTQVECTDWSNRMTKEKGWIDELRVTIDSQEFTDFLIYEAYK